MYGYHVVGVFETYDAAEKARARLRSAGVSDNSIHLSHDNPYDEDESQHHGFWDWLFGGESSRRDRDWYHTNLTGGRTAVSVLVPDDHDHFWVAEQLIAAGALDLEDEADSSVNVQSIRSRTSGSTSRTSAYSGEQSYGARGGIRSDEQVIPVQHEELDVGKRVEENRYRVRAHVVERPIEKDVTLRDERYVVERRPTTGRAVTGAGNFEDRDYEIIERHEQPMVQKRTIADEEVVIRKDVRDRTEKVRDTVRETRVDTDKNLGAGTNLNTTNRRADRV